MTSNVDNADNNEQAIVTIDSTNNENIGQASRVEMPTIHSNDNLILETFQNSTDVLSDYGVSMYSPQFRNNSNFSQKSRLQYCLVFLNHVSMQISLLSLLEPLLFFYFIISLEKDLFYQQLDSFVVHTFDVFDETTVSKIRSQVFYPMIFEFFNYEQIYVDNLFLSLENDAEHASRVQQEIVNALFEKAFNFAIVCNTLNLVYSLGMLRMYGINMFEILTHHIILIFCIGMYEIWFFTTIVINYLPWTKEEILFYVFQCIWLQYSEKFPELKETQHNVTMTCSV